MVYSDIYTQLPGALLPWYYVNKRDLPWRADREPYHIWLSEIMLQQTRVEAVKGYYSRFLDTLPTIESLANAEDALLHKLWEGLGYYSRVRNLKKAAAQIMEVHGGIFPREYADILALPGIGAYTAGAICSIVYDLSTPAVDGNVLRVVSRLTDDDTPIDLPNYMKAVNQALTQVYPPEAGDFTQAIIELGATVCGPNRRPDCENCPCRAFCLGHLRGTAEKLPVKQPKKSRRREELTVFILSSNGQYALEKRHQKGLLAGLWQFPNVPGKLQPQEALQAVEKMGLRPRGLLMQLERRHIFTHVEWDMRGVYIEVSETDNVRTWFTAEQIRGEAALPTAFRRFWEEIEHV